MVGEGLAPPAWERCYFVPVRTVEDAGPYKLTFNIPFVGRGFTPAVENNVTLLLFMCENVKHEAVELKADLFCEAH